MLRRFCYASSVDVAQNFSLCPWVAVVGYIGELPSLHLASLALGGLVRAHGSSGYPIPNGGCGIVGVGLDQHSVSFRSVDGRCWTLPHEQVSCDTVVAGVPESEPHHNISDAISRVFNAQNGGYVAVLADGTVSDTWRPDVMLGSSLNPIHSGHIDLLAKAGELSGTEKLSFELSSTSPAKGLLSVDQILCRVNQCAGEFNVIFDTIPFFTEKSEMFPGCTFVVGFDTAARILDPKYYGEEGLEGALRRVQEARCSFLVAGRLDSGGGGFLTVERLQIPPHWRHLFAPIDFRADVSSSEIRSRTKFFPNDFFKL